MVKAVNLSKKFRKSKPTESWSAQWLEILKRKLTRTGKGETVTALDDVSFEVRKGEFFGLLGPNGAGKTTLIKILCTLLTPDEGTAYVNGYNIEKEAEKVRRSVCLVASGGWVGLDNELTVRENLWFTGLIFGLKKETIKERTDEVIEIVGLKEKENEIPRRISSGMNQRLIIARGLMVRTPILFLDEPTVGIDPKGARDLRIFLKKLSEGQKRTIIFTTHRMYEAETLCDRVAILNKGRLIACGRPEELKRKLPWDGVIEIYAFNLFYPLQEIVNSIPIVDMASISIEDETIGSGVVKIRSRALEEALPEVVKVLKANNVEIRDIQTVKPSLEDAFVYLTGS